MPRRLPRRNKHRALDQVFVEGQSLVEGPPSRHSGHQRRRAARCAQSLGCFIHGAQQEVLASRPDAKTGALRGYQSAGESGQPPERVLSSRPSQTPGKRGRPAPQVLPEKMLLRRPADGQLFGIELVLEGVSFLCGKDTHECQLQANMIVPLAGVGGHLKPERAVKCGQVSETMRLEERIGFDIAILDLVQGTTPARGVAERRQVRGME